MLVDKNLEICDNTNVAAAAGTAVVGNTLDLGAAGIDLNSGRNLFLVITPSVSFVSAGGGKLQFRLVSDTVTPVATGTAIEHMESGLLAVADLALGKRLIWPLPQGELQYLRYLGLIAVTSVATVTAGSINAFLTMNPGYHRMYPAVTG